MEVHWFAARFPMLPDDELAALADSIATTGQQQPIMLSTDGERLLDGRNRLVACEQAGVEPHFDTLAEGVDEIDYIIASNVRRRHMGKGAQAMAEAVGHPHREQGRRRQTSSLSEEVGAGYLSMARTVLDEAPELVDRVLMGASLPQAYAVALENKRRREQDAVALVRLRRDYPDLARRVDDGSWSLAQALAAADAAEREQSRVRERDQLRAEIRLSIEEIGQEIPIPAPPMLTVALATAPDGALALPKDKPGDDTASLKEVQRFLNRLIAVKRELARMADEPINPDAWWLDGRVNAVRAAVSEIVTHAYGIASAYNAVLDEQAQQRLRSVK